MRAARKMSRSIITRAAIRVPNASLQVSQLLSRAVTPIPDLQLPHSTPGGRRRVGRQEVGGEAGSGWGGDHMKRNSNLEQNCTLIYWGCRRLCQLHYLKTVSVLLLNMAYCNSYSGTDAHTLAEAGIDPGAVKVEVSVVLWAPLYVV